jgi:Uri superfamily endonuclease
MDKGCYCLVFSNPACTVRVGALGELPFAKGWHLYIGSALGPGGLTRLTRHLRLARTKDRQPKWHVDYLLTDTRFTLAYAVSAATPERLECRLAANIGGRDVPHFGCSDCTCRSHLLYRNHDPGNEVMAAFARLGLTPGHQNTDYPKGEG